MKPFSERLSIIFKSLNTTPYRFANENEGFNKAGVFNMIGGRTKPNLDMLERICAAEPRISAEYLLRGKGEPLLDLAEALTTVEQLQAFKAEMIQALDRRIEQLQ